MDQKMQIQDSRSMPVKVRQQTQSDCGVACLSMASGLPYSAAREVFVATGLSIKRGRKAAFSSNFKELQLTLERTGVPSKLKRFTGWHCIGQAAILKVFRKKNGDWHWVFAGRDRERGLFIHDPATDRPSYEHMPMDVMCVAFSAYQPLGCFIHIDPDIK